MKKLLAILSFVLLAVGCSSCAGKNYSLTEGPLRLNCAAPNPIAIVQQPWRFQCLIEGDLVAYGNSPIGYVLTLQSDEEFPQAIVRAPERVLNVDIKLHRDYYYVRNGKGRPLGPNDHILDQELFREGDPRKPLPPIEGEGNEFDSSFYVEIQLFDMRGEKPKQISTDRVHGRVNCPQCEV